MNRQDHPIIAIMPKQNIFLNENVVIGVILVNCI